MSGFVDQMRGVEFMQENEVEEGNGRDSCILLGTAYDISPGVNPCG